MSDTKHCTRCRTTKPLDDFALQAKANDGRQSYCRPCMTDYHRHWRFEVRAEPEGSTRRAKLEKHYAELKTRWA